MYQRLLEIGAASAAMLGIGVAHWFPWPNVLPNGRKLHRIEAYAIGTGIILACTSAALLAADRAKLKLTPAECARLNAVVTVSAGAATVAAYWLDHAINHHQQPLGPGDF
jgi:hypothetical protein